jgi:short/branched chain acyl-CoA dehydrogenase
MGIETPPEYDGSGASFTAAIIAVEGIFTLVLCMLSCVDKVVITELAKIDPAVSVCCDVHNTLVNVCRSPNPSQSSNDTYALLFLRQSSVFTEAKPSRTNICLR